MAALVLAGSFVSIGTRGLCFMPVTGDAGVRGAHACCKTTGMTAAAPACCMAGQADEAPAVLMSHMTAAAPAAKPALAHVAQPPLPYEANRAAPPQRIHSPPGKVVLRI